MFIFFSGGSIAFQVSAFFYFAIALYLIIAGFQDCSYAQITLEFRTHGLKGWVERIF